MPQTRPDAVRHHSEFKPDAAQQRAIEALDRLAHKLVETDEYGKVEKRGLLSRWLSREPVTSAPVRGVYLWGGVGRGKTMIMDRFFEALPFPDKLRLHFHRFMQRVHHDLKNTPDTVDPLKQVAEGIAKATRVLCLDEFVVIDITDAMIMHGLLKGLFERGVTLVTTSNVSPDNLYKDGLQRARFVPTIALLHDHIDVLEVDAGVDYRLRLLEQAPTYRVPSGAEADAELASRFDELVPELPDQATHFVIHGRRLQTRRLSGDVVWFDFDALCRSPRSAADYIELARCFHTVMISGVPVMGKLDDDAARRLVTLVDEFYDRGVKLVISADAPPDALYQGERLSFEFQRTASRLTEMQSHDYLACPHRP